MCQEKRLIISLICFPFLSNESVSHMENACGLAQKRKYFKITTFASFLREEVPKQWCHPTIENAASLDRLFIQHQFCSNHIVLDSGLYKKQNICKITFLLSKNSRSRVVNFCIWSSCPCSFLRSLQYVIPQLLSKSVPSKWLLELQTSGVSSCQRVFGLSPKRAIDF